MTQNLIALYDDFDDARNAVEALVDSGIARNNISIVANDASGEYGQNVTGGDDDVKGGQGAGFGAVIGTLIGLGTALIPGIGPVVVAGPAFAALFAGLGAAGGAATGGITASLVKLGSSEEEAGYYAEGVRRGGTLVTVQVEDAMTDSAETILNRFNPTDIEHRGSTYREGGYTGFSADAQPYNRDQIMQERERYRSLNTGEEAHIDVVQEDLQVGKRDVERGTMRVRKYVTETPVQEQVTLREEHVDVERRPVNRAATSADMNAFQEETIEITEHGQEPVVSKTARVIEEVVISKDVMEHTETVSDTVRRTDVEVEETTGGTGMTYGDYNTYENDFRTHYTTNFANSGYTFEQYSPAYRYGYNLGTSDMYTGRNWTEIETDARTRWEERNPGTWDQFKDSVRGAWEHVSNRDRNR